MTWAAMLLLGGAMGFLAGFLGTGGGTLAIPALVLLFGYDQKLAQGTVLVMVILNVIKGFAKYRNYSELDTKLVTTLAVSASLASIAGAVIAFHLPSANLRWGYGLFLLLMIGPILLAKQGVRLKTPLSAAWAIVPGVLGGVTLGMFGVGGAMLTVPFLTTCFGYNQLRAQGAGLAVAVPGCILSFLPYLQYGQVDWPVAALLAAGSLATVSLGVKAAHAVDERWLVGAFCLLLSGTGLSLLLR